MYFEGLKNKIESYCEYWLDITVIVSLIAIFSSIAIMIVFLTLKSIVCGLFADKCCE